MGTCGLDSHRGNTPACLTPATGAAGACSSFVIPREVQVPFRGDPRLHPMLPMQPPALDSWLHTLFFFSYISSESDFWWHAAEPVFLPRLTAALWLLCDVVLVCFHWLVGYFLLWLEKECQVGFSLSFFPSLCHSSFHSEQEHSKFRQKFFIHAFLIIKGSAFLSCSFCRKNTWLFD